MKVTFIAAAVSFALVGCDNTQEEPATSNATEPTVATPNEPTNLPETTAPIINAPSDATEPADTTAPTNSSEADDLMVNEQGRDHLIPINQTATVNISNAFANNHSASLTVDEIIRGEAALDYINTRMDRGAFQAVAPRDADYEYLVARITFTLHAVTGAEQLRPSRMRSYSGEFEGYPTLMAASFFNETDFIRLADMNVNIGETVTGYMIFQVRITDDRPMMTYESMRADGSDGL